MEKIGHHRVSIDSKDSVGDLDQLDQLPTGENSSQEIISLSNSRLKFCITKSNSSISRQGKQWFLHLFSVTSTTRLSLGIIA